MKAIMYNTPLWFLYALLFGLGALAWPWFIWLALGCVGLCFIGLLFFMLHAVLHPARGVRPTPIQRATGRR
jgi:hypothetical protein